MRYWQSTAVARIARAPARTAFLALCVTSSFVAWGGGAFIVPYPAAAHFH